VGAATLTSALTTTVADLDRSDIALAAAGNTQAFERVYRRHVERIHGLCRRMLSPEEADDATQEVFIRAWQKLHLFRGESAFGTWLHRLAVNMLLGKRQSYATQRSRIDSEADVVSLAARRDRADLRVDFEGAIATLPHGARQVFLLHDVEGYTHEEIAGMLSVNIGTSKSQLHRARLSLRKYLG
jgi:RNA polymerase sigma factor (sigma-70 family)